MFSFRALEWILHLARSARNGLSYLRLPPYPHRQEFIAKQSVMKRNKLLHIKKYVIRTPNARGIPNSLSAQSAGGRRAQLH
ncbi:MAG: hypothetical protein AUF67_07030 [Acidobacteria bacterium 13_1_20CM_58_21]|nr:MAG: hypothetical protein AUF67_07030 [Acidobacteria bacterium 13_1_20CM_58_21]